MRNYFIKTIILFCSLFLCLCCSKKVENVEKRDICPNTNIDSIYVSYFNQPFFINVSAQTFEDLKNLHRPTFKKEYYGREGKYRVDYRGVIDTVLTDCNVLASIEQELQKSTICDFMKSVDARMSMIIKYDNDIRDTLIFEMGGIVYTCKGEGYWGSMDLCYIIRKNIGFYSWLHKEKPEYWDSYLFELDTLNRRDSIKIWIDNNPIVQGATLDY